MIFPRFLLAAGVVGSAVAPPQANAQIASTCMRVLYELVGKPLISSTVTGIGGEVGKYLVERMKDKDSDDETVRLSERDIRELERRAQRQGMSDCELRQELENAALGAGRNSYADTPHSQSYPQYQQYQQYPRYPGPPPASMCSTPAGYCQMMQPVPIGAPCFCATPAGRFDGIAQ